MAGPTESDATAHSNVVSRNFVDIPGLGGGDREMGRGDSGNTGDLSSEVECPICMKIFYKPLSTSCGHTFCRLCLDEALAVQPVCPMCRSHEIVSHPNRILERILEKQFPVLMKQRRIEMRNIHRKADLEAVSLVLEQASRFLGIEIRERQQPAPAEVDDRGGTTENDPLSAHQEAAAPAPDSGAGTSAIAAAAGQQEPTPRDALPSTVEAVAAEAEGCEETIRAILSPSKASQSTKEGLAQPSSRVDTEAGVGEVDDYWSDMPTGITLPVIFCQDRYELPIPNEVIEMYLEAPSLVGAALSVRRGNFPSLFLGVRCSTDSSTATTMPLSSSSPRNMPVTTATWRPRRSDDVNQVGSSSEQQTGPFSGASPAATSTSSLCRHTDITPSASTSPTNSAGLGSPPPLQHEIIPGVLLQVIDCAILGTDPLRREAQQQEANLPHHGTSWWWGANPGGFSGGLAALGGRPSGVGGTTVLSTIPAEVPQRLHHHREKFEGNKRQSRDTPCCILKCRVRFRSVAYEASLSEFNPDPGLTATSLNLEQCPCSTAAVSLVIDSRLAHFNEDGQSPLVIAAHALREKLKQKVESLGSSERALFDRRFGPVPWLAQRPTSVQVEAFTLWALKVAKMSPREKAQLLASSDSSSRIRILSKILNDGGSVFNLGLSSSRGTVPLHPLLMFEGFTGSTWLTVGLILVIILGGLYHRKNVSHYMVEMENAGNLFSFTKR